MGSWAAAHCAASIAAHRSAREPAFESAPFRELWPDCAILGARPANAIRFARTGTWNALRLDFGRQKQAGDGGRDVTDWGCSTEHSCDGLSGLR